MALQEWVNKTVSIITSDGRNIVGSLKGFDQTMNVILEQSHERVFSEDKGVSQNPLGLYIIRGDNIVVVAELDEEEDAKTDFSSVMAPPLKPVMHS
eukprot:CAMPEP_0184970380 /NCGR_PEP_ID=MMETSP1098-20130426/2894_1 /TAXON_ID=89044 /ORGANISM="Spumella elongata, Strain CCAP 955/1" /LENGTH=95 /DNA_ID=CAMNT_0027492317 /DNA_START=33 /DNA_END=320 /DNA_ORIENTATION=-